MHLRGNHSLFQFHKGTIKTLYSIFPGRLAKFQFHKGTIKTNNMLSDNIGSVIFQFHKGTIKTSSAYYLMSLYSYFNSIKVRLKLTKGALRLLDLLFQFHKGTIKTLLLFLMLIIVLNFNSIKVRLKL